MAPLRSDSAALCASRPVIAVSACLLGHDVRYDGRLKACPAVTDRLAALADLVPICPETGVGMPVPREPVDLFGPPSAPRMRGVDSGTDWTERVLAWAEAELDRLAALGVAAFVLKARSPSCGVGTAALYAHPGAEPRTSDGLFAAAARRRFPDHPIIEDEGLDAAALVAAVAAARARRAE
jgi:uncharacterized protein YbbK (DUF523 family)